MSALLLGVGIGLAVLFAVVASVDGLHIATVVLLWTAVVMAAVVGFALLADGVA